MDGSARPERRWVVRFAKGATPVAIVLGLLYVLSRNRSADGAGDWLAELVITALCWVAVAAGNICYEVGGAAAGGLSGTGARAVHAWDRAGVFDDSLSSLSAGAAVHSVRPVCVAAAQGEICKGAGGAARNAAIGRWRAAARADSGTIPLHEP